MRGVEETQVNRTNDVHGLAMCRGDLELPQGCSPCIQHAISEIGKLCPYMKNAAVFYDHCYLHYGNESFIGEMVGEEESRKSINNITKVNQEKFNKVREKLISKLLVEATNGTSSPKFFAAEEDSVSSDLSVFGLLQCIPDLSTKQCKRCLNYHVKDLPEYAGFSAGFLSIGYSCFLRYENKLFYNKPSLPPPLPSPSSPPPPSPSSPPPLPSPPPEISDDNEGNKLSTWKIIIIVASLVMGLTLILSLIGFRIWRKKKDKIDERGLLNEDKKLVKNVEYLSMKFEDLEIATNHFSQENKIGQGGFGFVYKGILDDQEITVKRLIDKDSLQGPDQLEKEVNLLAGLQHKNLVSLYGYCIERGEMLLVYEYMPNGSLEKHLFDPTPSMGVLNWNSRLNIIDGILKGIRYFHEDSRLKIFHCDLKPENILLDSNMTPKISDFGISKYFDVNQTRECTTINIVGTSGYMVPEYRFFGNFSTKSDMYSLGVMLIEILTGKRWSRQINSCEKANNLKSNVSKFHY
ncbi:receptor kinase 2 [Zostera marina]|uniref:non-specific serine/threonine protein kinase n=1 Tax=Zostera marina TaxID=29655 RepID=A0A0K9PB10_ZOSMR|nr:receptor kinase 2 [Zostera marina]